MPFVTLDIPAGVVKHGTDSHSNGRWTDANLVRWINGSLRNIAGWQYRVSLDNAIYRASIAWKANDGTGYFAAGSATHLTVMDDANTVTDITPVNMPAPAATLVYNLGYGKGAYGQEKYGQPKTNIGVTAYKDIWSLGTWGQYLVGCKTGPIYEWQANPANPAAIIANSPVADAIAVTEERFLFAFGADNNKRLVKWCDREDNTVWTAAATNEAGDMELSTHGEILQGLSVRGKTLILTTSDAHTATYLGPPVVYGFEKVGSSCGSISRHSGIAIDEGAFWMGEKSFFHYNGSAVRELPCDVHDHVFNNMNQYTKYLSFGINNGLHNELWWFYPSKGSLENDSYVIYNYTENYWNIGKIERSTGVDAGVFQKPLYVDGRHVFNHETLNVYENSQGYPYAKTGPLQIGNGDQLMSVTEVIPDYRGRNAVSGDIDFRVVLKARMYPNADDVVVDMTEFTDTTPVRLQGREVRVEIYGGAFDFNYDNITNAALRATVNLPEPFISDEVNGRMIGDLNNDGFISSADAVGWLDGRNNIWGDTVDYDFYYNHVMPYLLGQLPLSEPLINNIGENVDGFILGKVRLNVEPSSKR